MDQEWMTGGYQNDLIYSLCPVSRATILYASCAAIALIFPTVHLQPFLCLTILIRRGHADCSVAGGGEKGGHIFYQMLLSLSQK